MQKLDEAKVVRAKMTSLTTDNVHIIGDDVVLAKGYREQIKHLLGFDSQELSSYQRIQIRKFALALRDIEFRKHLYKRLSIYISIRDRYADAVRDSKKDSDYINLLNRELIAACVEINKLLSQNVISSISGALVPALPRQDSIADLKFIEDYCGVPLNPYYLVGPVSFVDYQGQEVIREYNFDEQKHNLLADEFNELTEDGFYNSYADVQIQTTDSWLQLNKKSHPKFVIEIESGTTFPQLVEFLKNNKSQIEMKLGKSSPRLTDDFAIKQKSILLKRLKYKMPEIINTLKLIYGLELTEEQVSDLIRK